LLICSDIELTAPMASIPKSTLSTEIESVLTSIAMLDVSGVLIAGLSVEVASSSEIDSIGVSINTSSDSTVPATMLKISVRWTWTTTHNPKIINKATWTPRLMKTSAPGFERLDLSPPNSLGVPVPGVFPRAGGFTRAGDFTGAGEVTRAGDIPWASGGFGFFWEARAGPSAKFLDGEFLVAGACVAGA
jgi:hypothetical protein